MKCIYKIISTPVVIAMLLVLMHTKCGSNTEPEIDEILLEQARKNGRLANEGFLRPYRYVHDWLEFADPVTGLIPRNLHGSIDLWDQKDAAADNYPYMVITSAITDRELFKGRMLKILQTETEITSRIGRIADEYSFSKGDFLTNEPDLGKMIFGNSEYIKDGLLVITEWLGQSPWSERMLGILDDIWELAPIETRFGMIISIDNEINGEMLQILSRVYWMTGDEQYLEYAIRLGDYYLLGDHHPTRNLESLRLRDHGCEIVSGLSELYATLHYVRTDKKEEYQEPLYEMLDRILEVGRNEDGLFYDVINPQTGEILVERIADTFGYTFNAYYTVYQLDGIDRYREAVLQSLDLLNSKYRNYDWENSGVDGYADAIEGTLNLYNREPISSTKDWLDSEIQVMWRFQDDHPGPRGEGWNNSGIIEGMHPDGNFARTSLMYALWKTRGITAQPWSKDLYFGATVQTDGSLVIHLSAKNAWNGKLLFDRARHSTFLNMPHDWPRINQFPEWFTADADKDYIVVDTDNNNTFIISGQELQDGILLNLETDQEIVLIVKEYKE